VKNIFASVKETSCLVFFAKSIIKKKEKKTEKSRLHLKHACDDDDDGRKNSSNSSNCSRLSLALLLRINI
jgi:hypothetical protein